MHTSLFKRFGVSVDSFVDKCFGEFGANILKFRIGIMLMFCCWGCVWKYLCRVGVSVGG